MIKIILPLVFLLFQIITVHSQVTNPAYDSTLAKSLGADDFGMKMYVLVILKTGDYTPPDEITRDSLFRGHMENINRLEKLKKLIVVGPFGKNENDFRGLFILDVPGLEEAKILLDTDPVIKSGLLKPESYYWYGSAALPQYLDDSDKIWKKTPL